MNSDLLNMRQITLPIRCVFEKNSWEQTMVIGIFLSMINNSLELNRRNKSTPLGA